MQEGMRVTWYGGLEPDPPPHSSPVVGSRFDQLFAQHTDAIFRYFARRAPRQDTADLTADVFAIAWRRIDSIPRDFELPWLYKTASNVLANYRRKPKLTLLSESGWATTEAIRLADDDNPCDVVMAQSSLKSALMQLKDRDRQVLLMNAWEGLDGQELALALGMSRGGAAATLSRARSRFRHALEGYDADQPASPDKPLSEPRRRP